MRTTLATTKSRCLAAGILSLALFGCVSTPPIEEMSQLNQAQAEALLAGNTLTLNKEYGSWAEYIGDDLNGVGKAWGNWGEEKAASVHSFSPDGEWCSTYPEKTHKWTGEDHRYCSFIYVDEAGNNYVKITLNTSKPEREGELNRVEIKPGNHYELSM